MSTDGKWGISFFTSAECEKITVECDSLTKEAITFSEIDTLSEVFIDESDIYACGYSADDSGFKVFVYNTEGTAQVTLTFYYPTCEAERLTFPLHVDKELNVIKTDESF